MSRLPADRVPFVQCEWQTKCNTHAYVQVRISGTHAHARQPIKTCRTHIRLVIADFITVSNDIRVRSTNP